MEKDNILINKWEESQIFDKIFEKNLNKKIILDSDSNLKYLIISSWSNIDLEFSSSGDGANFEIYGIFFSKNKDTIKWNISVLLSNNNAKANVYLLSLMWDDAIIKVKWSVDIGKWIKWVSGYLLEENVVLGKKIKINTLPILNVASNDVRAWHWAKVQKLDNEKLFYMTSKWLSSSKSKEIIVKWYINYILEKFDILEKEKNEIEELILNYLL